MQSKAKKTVSRETSKLLPLRRLRLKMTSSLSPSVVCISLSSSSFSPKFKLPAKSAPSSLSALHHEQQALRALSPISSADNSAGDSTWVCNRRRIMLSIAWFGQLQGSMEGLIARAAELDTDQYTLVKEEVRKYVSKAKAAGVLRLVFHDAGTFALDDKTGGMNGSIIYELDRPENAGLKKSVKVLEKAKSELNAKQPVSWADLISVAGAEAVSICGGPTIPVSLGRLDSLSTDPPERLPEETLDASGLKRSFQKKGLSTQEMVALSGAHTIGGKGFGSPTLFDNTYYKILLEKPWSDPGNMSSMVGLPSDHALVEDDECLKWIKAYANDQNLFFEDFKNAYIKLINSGANWRTL